MNQLNPFYTEEKLQSISVLAQRESSTAIAEVQAAMVIARANPRDQRQAMDNILNACTRPGLAESAIYNYSKGGTDIQGPSIRLAEVMAQNWGNIQFGLRELETDEKESTVQAYCWDVQTNTKREITFTVKHVKDTKQGQRNLKDEREKYENLANLGARRVRSCILSVIPGDVQEAAVSQCEITMKAKADLSPEGIKKVLDAFEKFGVTKEQIEKFIQRRIDSIQAAQVVRLKKIYASIKDGMSKTTDWFESNATQTDSDDIINQTLSGKQVEQKHKMQQKQSTPDWEAMLNEANTQEEVMAIYSSIPEEIRASFNEHRDFKLDELR